MELFQSWADTVLMFILAVAYIVTYIVQRTTIKKLQDQINAIEKTNNAAKVLTDIQSSHIDTYKKLVDIYEIDKNAHIKATNILTDLILNKEDFLEDIKKSADKVINQELIENNIEHIRFLKFTLNNILKFDLETQKKIIKKNFPSGESLILHLYDKI